MNKRVVITGLGVVSSLGTGKDVFWSGLLQGKSGISLVSSVDTAAQFTHNGGEVKDFRPEEFISAEKIPVLSRASQLALAAAKLALEDANLPDREAADRCIGTCVGVTSGSVQTIELINDELLNHREVPANLFHQLPVNTPAAAIAREFNFRGPNFLFSTACAAGNYALGCGYDTIRAGRADIVLAGGADPFSRISFTGFNQFSAVAPEKCRPFDLNRKGMMVAEGAGILVVESLESALKRKASIYAEILGYGLSCDAYHMTSATVEGIAGCMRAAMEQAGIAPGQVDYISAHGTGTRANDRAECAAIKEVFGPASKTPPVSSIKSMLGHAMGAASALEAVVCALAVKTDMVPPTINFETPDPECNIDCVPNVARKLTVNLALNNSYAFGGNNASLVLSKFK